MTDHEARALLARFAGMSWCEASHMLAEAARVLTKAKRLREWHAATTDERNDR